MQQTCKIKKLLTLNKKINLNITIPAILETKN